MKVTFGAEVAIAATPSRAHQEAYRPGEEMPPVFNKDWPFVPTATAGTTRKTALSMP